MPAMNGPHTVRVVPPPARASPAEGGGTIVWAPAKLNLSLLVGPRGADGYHPLDSLVARAALCDRLLLRPRDDGRIVLRCESPDCGPAERNLAVRAARALRERRGGPDRGVEIDLLKAIPPGAGLGGGSSDAAAVLLVLNELWGTGLSPTELAEVGAALGSDVPLFLAGPASRIRGRGERVEPIEVHPFTAVLLLPPLACATPAVYAAFDESPRPMGEPPDTGLLRGRPSEWRGLLRNELGEAARKVCPGLSALWDAAAAAAGAPVCLTGSGSGLFILCDDVGEASAVLRRLPEDLPCRRVVAPSNPW
jgi:4-diphosphocytidyl-2-C-methyl-D-erythritol kinase